MASPDRQPDFEELSASLDWLRGLARRLTGDVDAADDLAQEALMEGVVALAASPVRTPAFGAHGGLRGWLAARLRNRAFVRARGEARRRSREAHYARPEGQASTLEVVERAALSRRLIEAVLALDEPYRSAVLLRHVDGLDSTRIARRTGVTPAAARKRVARGLAALRQRLDGERGGLAALLPLARDPRVSPAPLLPTLSPSLTGSALVTKSSMSVPLALGLIVSGGLIAAVALNRATGEETAAAQAQVVANPPAPSSAGLAGAEPESVAPAAAPEPIEAPLPGAPAGNGEALGTAAESDELARLESIGETFLTATPDFDGLGRLVAQLGQDARVVEGSVATDRDGIVHGKLWIEALGVEGSFSILDPNRANDYFVSIPTGYTGDSQLPLISRDLSLGLSADSVGTRQGSIHMQFHPDTRQDPRDSLAAGVEQHVGWHMLSSANGSHASPIAVSHAADVPGGWIIGRPSQLEPLGFPGAFDLAPYDPWLALLEPWMPKD